MLIPQEATLYLKRRGFISAEDIVDGDLEIVDVSRRNCNFKVITNHGPSYLLKQGSNADKIASLVNEAAIYRLLQSNFKDNRSNRYMPRFFAHDAQEHILIVEFVQDSRDLRDHHGRIGRVSPALGARMGTALAELHRRHCDKNDMQNSCIRVIEPPGVLSLHCPTLTTLRNFSATNVRVIEILQQFDEFGEFLDGLRNEWRTETLIHCDLRWDNWLVPIRGRHGGNYGLKIVDWELAGMGDPCWDVGSVIADYLGFWLFSIPVSSDTPPDRLLDLARYPLQSMQPAVLHFWQSYALHMELSAARSREWLVRAMRYSAAQLLLTTVAQMEVATRITGHAICCLQLAHNILRQPEEAIVALLGIPCRG